MVLKGNYLLTKCNTKETKYENVSIEFFDDCITLEASGFSKLTLSLMEMLEVSRVNINKYGKKVSITVDSFLEESEIQYDISDILMNSSKLNSFLEMLSKNKKMDLTLVLSTGFGKTKYYMYSLKDEFVDVEL